MFITLLIVVTEIPKKSNLREGLLGLFGSQFKGMSDMMKKSAAGTQHPVSMTK